MIWIYAVILAFSAGLLTYVLSRTADRLTAFLGIEPLAHSILGYAAIVVLAFLMIAQAPAMMLTCALILWFAGSRHAQHPMSIYVQAGLLMLTAILGLASLSSPQFDVPPQIPKAAIMFAVYVVWVSVSALPMGAPSHGLFAALGASLGIFIVGAVAFSLSTAIASDAIILGGALVGAWLGMRLSNSHHGLAGQWVFLYLLGFLAASAAYQGAWWLGLLGIAPMAVYTLLRKA